MRILIVTDLPSIAEAYARNHQLPDWKWVFEFQDLDDEENVGIVFTGNHYDLPNWFAIRKKVEKMVQEGKAEWYLGE